MIAFNFTKSSYKKEVLELVKKKELSTYIDRRCGNRTVKLNYNFISSKEQIKINKEFKKHKYNTDILTFDLSNKECELTGDVYISLKQVKKNAKRYSVSLKDELIFNVTVPAKLQAYLCTKKPILGMLNGEGVKIINEANCGLCVNAGDSIKLAEKILEFYQMSNDNRNVLGANGFKYFEENFTLGKCIDDLESILKN